MVYIILLTVAGLVIAVLIGPKGISELMNKFRFSNQMSHEDCQNTDNNMNTDEQSVTIREVIHKVNNLHQEIVSLKSMIAAFLRTSDEIKRDLTEKLLSLDKSMVEWRSSNKYLTSRFEDLEAEFHACSVISIPKSDNVTSNNFPLTKYISQMNVEINGFSHHQLTGSPEGAIYEVIMVSNDIAKYRLVGNEISRREFFQMMNNAIEPFCNISVECGNPQIILDVEDGTLKRSGDQWIILSKASIKLI